VVGVVVNPSPLIVASQVAVYKALQFQYKGQTQLPTPEHEYMDASGAESDLQMHILRMNDIR
jgi:hypothetical protein